MFSERQTFQLDELIALTLPISMLLFGNVSITLKSVAVAFAMWNAMLMIGAFAYSLMAINVGHHVPQNVHEGDEFHSFDYGVYQLAATIERTPANANLFVSLTNFGDHMLHHMFPSLDHSVLRHLRKTLAETCSDFKEDFRKCSIWEAMVGQFQQLGRTEYIKLNQG